MYTGFWEWDWNRWHLNLCSDVLCYRAPVKKTVQCYEWENYVHAMDILLMSKTGCKTHTHLQLLKMLVDSMSKVQWSFRHSRLWRYDLQCEVLELFALKPVWQLHEMLLGPSFTSSLPYVIFQICTWPPWYWQSDSEQISSLSKLTSQVPSWSASSSPSTLPVLWTSLDILQRLVFDCLDQGTRKFFVLL
jgi:hypothetical protein